MNNILSSKTVAGVKDQGSFLQAGIHNAVFKGVDKDVFTANNGEVFTTMAFTFDIAGFGEYKHRLFEPKGTERTENTWGFSPSQVEQFFVTLKHFLDTINPSVGQAIGEGTSDLEGNFDLIITKVKAYSKDFIGKSTQVKMVPQKSGFNQFPGFPARITQNNNLVLGTKFIGENLVLSAYELKAIEDAKNARPTDMSTKYISDTLSELSSDMADEDELDDLPF